MRLQLWDLGMSPSSWGPYKPAVYPIKPTGRNRSAAWMMGSSVYRAIPSHSSFKASKHSSPSRDNAQTCRKAKCVLSCTRSSQPTAVMKATWLLTQCFMEAKDGGYPLASLRNCFKTCKFLKTENAAMGTSGAGDSCSTHWR